MLASLPMYDLPEVREANDSFWAAVAKAYGVHGTLTRDADWSASWRNPTLLFSQTCGYPFTHDFADILKYVATPHYDAEGCEGPLYRSILFAREAAGLATFKGKVAAFNNRDSMSGMLALQLVFAPLADDGKFFGGTVETGGHAASLAAVQAGKADVCATDCVTLAYLRRYRPAALNGLVQVGVSPQVPGLPYVTRGGHIPGLRAAVAQVMADRSTEDVRSALLLKGASVLPDNAYAVIPEREAHMRAAGGLSLF